jgi:hypothetical protein
MNENRNLNNIEMEARIFTKYLIAEDANEKVLFLYRDLHNKVHFEFDEKESKMYFFLLKHPAFLGIIDGGLALHDKNSIIRKKLFYLLAILETIPEYSNHYMIHEASLKDFLFFLLFGIRGVYRMILGYILVFYFRSVG